MSEHGKGGKAKSGRKAKSHSLRSQLQFPVGRLHSMLRKDNYAGRIQEGAPFFLAAVLEYFAAEVFFLTGNAVWGINKINDVDRSMYV
ncbi:core histone H2A/H2B/H3/H4 [Necator americanus]|uniref:Histone H2A n=1 Tax=Necator americanus TaxID=51031 RepID=W2SN48_NECAM|nr:core histone H2A/H2B/H3/H4 [Necator americanus]ETN70137.1 core histone H2A/H2B/H3/H4 [Necator americanus]